MWDSRHSTSHVEPYAGSTTGGISAHQCHMALVGLVLNATVNTLGRVDEATRTHLDRWTNVGWSPRILCACMLHVIYGKLRCVRN